MPNTVNSSVMCSGINTPKIISEQLRVFLGLEKGILISQTKVGNAISKYVKNNNLKMNGRYIDFEGEAGEKLKVILKLGEGSRVSFFNIQIFFKHHFDKVYIEQEKIEKIEKINKGVFEELKLLPPFNSFPGGQFYQKHKKEFELLV